MNTNISSHLVEEYARMDTVDKLFGIKYVLKLEPTVFQFAEQLAENYDYGYWQFYTLSNGGFYMAPRGNAGVDIIYNVTSDNGFDGQMSADALGIVACMYAYSNLSFGGGMVGTNAFAQACADQFHLLRAYLFLHDEVLSILRAID